MRYEFVIAEDGTVTTTVLDRGESVCSDIKQVTRGIGKELSDEVIGPESDDVHEVNY